MPFNNFPYVNLQNLNLDWILHVVKQAASSASEAAQTVAGYASRLLNLEDTVENQQEHIGTLENDVEALTEDVHSNTAYIREVDGVANSANDKADALDDEAVKTTVQNLNTNEKLQARVNISAGSSTVVYDDEMEAIIITDEITGELETVPVGGGGGGSADAVLYTAQQLTNSQKQQARQNIGAGKSTVSYNENTGVLSITDADAGVPTAYYVPSDTVRYGAAQTLTEAQKAQARQNIGAGTGTVENAVLFTAQTLTEGQKAQARTNIGVVNGNSIFLITAVYSNGEYTFDKNQADILSAIQSGMVPVVRYHTTAGQSDYNVYYEWVFDYYTYDGEDVYIYFSRVDQYGNSAQLKWYGSTGKATEVSRPTLPPATGADNGKIPQVNSFGDYQLVTPSAAQGTPKVTMTSSDTAPSLDANKFYAFPEMATLSVTLNTPANNAIVNEFHFRFTSGSTATQFDLPATVEIPDDFDVAADTVYEISIIDNYMVYSSWAVSGV